MLCSLSKKLSRVFPNFRKDFRQAKLDLSTGNIVPNTARWSNVDVVYEV